MLAWFYIVIPPLPSTHLKLPDNENIRLCPFESELPWLIDNGVANATKEPLLKRNQTNSCIVMI